MYCAKNECNTISPAPRRHKHPSSGANRPSDIGVMVNINAEFQLMAVNPTIECFSRDLDTEYCHSLESSEVYPAPSFFVETLPDRSNRSLPHLPLHTHAQAMIPRFLTSNIVIRLCLPNAPTCHHSGRKKCTEPCQSSESSKAWAFGEFSTSAC